MSTSNPVALVSGVGPGTGAAIARRFAQGGYQVAMLARNRARLQALEREITSSRAYACDVTDEARLDATIAAVRRDLGESPACWYTTRSGERSEISWKSSRPC